MTMKGALCVYGVAGLHPCTNKDFLLEVFCVSHTPFWATCVFLHLVNPQHFISPKLLIKESFMCAFWISLAPKPLETILQLSAT